MDSKLFDGSGKLFLQKYFELKIKALELETKLRWDRNEDTLEKLNKIKADIVVILSTFSKEQLTGIIHMTLNINYSDLIEAGYVTKRKGFYSTNK